MVVEKGGIFWEGGVYSGRVAYIGGKREVYSEREGYILGGSHV